MDLLFPGMGNRACIQVTPVRGAEPLFISVQRPGSPGCRRPGWVVILTLGDAVCPEFSAQCWQPKTALSLNRKLLIVGPCGGCYFCGGYFHGRPSYLGVTQMFLV